MSYLLISLLIFICFFIFYSLSKNDFILLRKDISLNITFNHVFIALIAGFIFGRFIYIFDTYKLSLINPIVFFHAAKYVGFSWFGEFLGSSLILFMLTRDKNVRFRILDIFSLSFYILFITILLIFPVIKITLIYKLILLFFLIIVFPFFINFHKNYVLKDGSIFFIILIILSFGNFIVDLFNKERVVIEYFSFSQILSILLVIFSCILLLKNEGLFFKKK